MASPADVASGIVPTSILEGSTGWKTQIGKLQPNPDKVACFRDTGGEEPNPKWLLDFPLFQVVVRGAEGEYAEAYAKAKEIRDVLLGLESQTIGSDRWVSIRVLSDIGLIGYDDSDRPMFSMNFRCIVEPADTGTNNRDPL